MRAQVGKGLAERSVPFFPCASCKQDHSIIFTPPYIIQCLPLVLS